MAEKFRRTNYEIRELSDSSPFGGPASDSPGVKRREGVADPFSNQVCVEALKFRGRDLWARPQERVVSRSNALSCLPSHLMALTWGPSGRPRLPAASYVDVSTLSPIRTS